MVERKIYMDKIKKLQDQKKLLSTSKEGHENVSLLSYLDFS